MSAGPQPVRVTDNWPDLTGNAWRETCTTLHLWSQILGKVRLVAAPAQNHYWHVALAVTARGLASPPVPWGTRMFEMELDLMDGRFVARTSDGGIAMFPLELATVADFYARCGEALRTLGVEPRIHPRPSEIEDPIRLDQDRAHGAYVPASARGLWTAVLQSQRVFQQFRGQFLGKCSPVHFWWGGFDLACTRFSGRPAPVHPGGIPNLPDHVTRESYSHECISAGWWPGTVGGPVSEPAFYAYAYPEPEGCPTAVVRPVEARYELALREWILPYQAVRAARDPDAVLLEFLHSTYEAAATLGRWDRKSLERGGAPA